MRTTTATCRRCSQWTPDGCRCTDHPSCKKCNMPRCVLLADIIPGTSMREGRA